jgi:hypothetical protein
MTAGCKQSFDTVFSDGTRVALWWAWLVLKGTKNFKDPNLNQGERQ